MQKQKLKIAVQIYGHLRTYKKCAPYLKRHLLDIYDCDVFMHTWDRLEHTTKSWYADEIRGDPLAVDDATVGDIRALYAPKKLEIQTQNFIDEGGCFGKISLSGIKYMLYSQHCANNLRLAYEKETGQRYDYVLVVRPDIMPFADIDFSRYQKELDFYARASIHLVHIPVITVKNDVFLNSLGAIDIFYFSTPATVTDITNCYLSFDRFFKDYASVLPRGSGRPEYALHEYMIEQSISPKQYRFYFAIKRNNDRDDIKILPPMELSSKGVISVRKHVVGATKRFLELLVRHTPLKIRRVIFAPFKTAADIHAYLESIGYLVQR